MVHSNWVGHSGVTSVQFGPVECSALWLFTHNTNGSVSHLTDTINLGVTIVVVNTSSKMHAKNITKQRKVITAVMNCVTIFLVTRRNPISSA